MAFHLDFDGIDDFAQLPSDLNITRPWTWEFDVEILSQDGLFVLAGKTDNLKNRFRIADQTDKDRFIFESSAGGAVQAFEFIRTPIRENGRQVFTLSHDSGQTYTMESGGESRTINTGTGGFGNIENFNAFFVDSQGNNAHIRLHRIRIWSDNTKTTLIHDWNANSSQSNGAGNTLYDDVGGLDATLTGGTWGGTADVITPALSNISFEIPVVEVDAAQVTVTIPQVTIPTLSSIQFEVEPFSFDATITYVSDSPALNNINIDVPEFTFSTTVTLVNPSADTTPPVISVSGDEVTTLTVGDPIPVFTDQMLDNRDGDITNRLERTGDVIDNQAAGTYVRRWNGTDLSGNAASEVTRTVIYQAVQQVTSTLNLAITNIPDGTHATVLRNVSENTTQVQNVAWANGQAALTLTDIPSGTAFDYYVANINNDGGAGLVVNQETE